MNIQPESRFKAWNACAKINLTLEVTGKREDGFHQIASVVQAVNLNDTLSFQPGEHLYLACNIPTLVSPDNIVYKAAKLLRDLVGEKKGISISIDKKIPLASGLGGGSSDAAMTLQALNQLWELDLSRDSLEKIAAKLGSDTSFFLRGLGTALAEGRGEKITSLPSLPETWVVLLKPALDIPSKTSSMYTGLDISDYTKGEAAQKMIGLLREGERITSSDCYNVFERSAFSRFPELEEYRRHFLSAGAGEIHLAGSGPTLFTLVENEDRGRDIYRQLEKERVEVFLVKTL